MILEGLGLGWHEESWVSADLSELGVTEGVLDDAVDEGQSNRVVFHLGRVKVVQQESGTFFNDDGVVSSIEGGLRFKSDLLVELRG